MKKILIQYIGHGLYENLSGDGIFDKADIMQMVKDGYDVRYRF